MTPPGPRQPFVEIFRSPSSIEAEVVRGLLDAHGIDAAVASALPLAVLNARFGHTEFGISVPAESAGKARELIAGHLDEAAAGEVRRLREYLGPLEKTIGYKFADLGLLEHAKTHRSRAHEDASGGVIDNESLEFLGDAVLGLVVADVLYHQYPDYSEGQKSKVKAAVVSTASLARRAEEMRLGDHLILGRGEEKTGGRFKQALLADAYEALIAALFLDGGLDAARAFLRRELKEAIDAGIAQTFAPDYKSALQERLQALGKPLPEYRVSGSEGPDHRKTFTIEVVVNGDVLGTATGRAKKEAEQEAARLALARLDEM